MDHQAFAQLLGNYGEFLGAIAVVITLAILTFQVAHAREALKATSHQNYKTRKLELRRFLASRDVSEIFFSGSNDPVSLDHHGRFVFHNTMASFLFWLETSYQMWRDGLIDESDWRTDLQLVREIQTSAGFKVWWPACREFFAEDFVELVDSTQPAQSTGFARFVAALDGG
jgi:hypothetical protein